MRQQVVIMMQQRLVVVVVVMVMWVGQGQGRVLVRQRVTRGSGLSLPRRRRRRVRRAGDEVVAVCWRGLGRQQRRLVRDVARLRWRAVLARLTAVSCNGEQICMQFPFRRVFFFFPSSVQFSSKIDLCLCPLFYLIGRNNRMKTNLTKGKK